MHKHSLTPRGKVSHYKKSFFVCFRSCEYIFILVELLVLYPIKTVFIFWYIF